MLDQWIRPLATRIGVRARFSLVALIAILPLMALLVADAVEDREVALKEAGMRALQLARLGAERQDERFRHANSVLTVIRRLAPLTATGPAQCHSAFQAIANDNPQFTAIGIVDVTGTVTCFSLSATPKPFVDPEVFRTAMAAAPSAFIVGRFRIGPLSGKRIAVAAVPLARDAKDEPPPGIAYVALDLDWAEGHAHDTGGPTDATWSLIDTRTATVLAGSHHEDQPTGEQSAGDQLVSAMLARPEGGTLEADGVDTTPMVYGYAPLVVGGRSGIMVAVGLSRAAVLADADHRFLAGIGLVVLTALGAAAVAWLIGDRTQFRAIRLLVDTARQLGRGDLAARANLGLWQAPEFRALSETLGEMAHSMAVTQASLKESEHQLRLLAENSTDMIIRIRQGGQRLYASPACRRLLGREPEEMLTISTRDAVHPDDIETLHRLEALTGEEPVTFTYRLRRKNGTYVWVESAVRAITVAPGQPSEQIALVRDIDQRVAAERNLKESEARYRLLAEHGTDMVFQLDLDLALRYVSPACRDILGYVPDDLIGKRPFDSAHPEDAGLLKQALQSVLCSGTERVSVISRTQHRDRRWIWVEAQMRGIVDPQSGAPSGIIGALRDISVRKAAEDQLEEANRRLEVLAGQDGLTGLANRRTFDDVLSREHRRAVRDGSCLALVMIDVDRFKTFNDCYGHPAGDECLRQVSRAIKQALRRPGDLAARYGGEEFAVLLPTTDAAGAASIAEDVRRAVMALAIQHDGSPSHIVTVSAGVAALMPEALEGGIEAFVQTADRALYLAKDGGRNAVVSASGLPMQQPG